MIVIDIMLLNIKNQSEKKITLKIKLFKAVFLCGKKKVIKCFKMGNLSYYIKITMPKLFFFINHKISFIICFHYVTVLYLRKLLV